VTAAGPTGDRLRPRRGAGGGLELLARRRALGRAVVALLLLAAAGATAQEPDRVFSGLTVIAFGEQEVDIVTGVTALPEGGQIIDREHGVTLTAEEMRYREGEFVQAESVEVVGRFGTAAADEVEVDLAAGTVDASGNLLFQRDDLRLAAESLHYDVGAAVVRFDGPVTGEGALLEAAAIVLDADSGALLLVAPYRYQDELFELSSEREGALLSLTPAEDGSGRLVATSRVDAGLLERLGPYLP
jgi:hypothetical protein